MKYETERLLCVTTGAVAHVQFKGTDVAEYGEAVKVGPELRHIVSEFEFQVMLIDCAALTFLTSTILEAFISVHLRCRRMGREVRIANTNGLIRDMFRVTRLDRMMPVYDTLEGALNITDSGVTFEM